MAEPAERYLPGNFWPSGNGLKIGGLERETMRLGLDLRGGAYLVLEADPPADYQGELDAAMDGAKDVVERRVNEFGVSEAEIQTTSGNRISVQVPGMSLADAQDLIGKTAALQFLVVDEAGNLTPATGVIDGQTIAMTGAHIKNNTYASRVGTTYAVNFETTGVGARLLEQITTRAVQYPQGDSRNLLVVALDGEILSQANVNSVIRDQGQITGQPTLQRRQ